MEKALRIALMLIVLGNGFAEEDPIVSQSGRLTLRLSDYRPFLELLTPEDRRFLLKREDQLREYVLDFHSDADLALLAESKGLDREPDVRAKLELARRKVLVEALMQRTLSQIHYPDFSKLSRERYEANREQYRTPERRKVAHIFIPKKKYCLCRPEDKRPAREIAEEVLAKLRRGEDFGKLAAEYSGDLRTRETGGIIEYWFTPGEERVDPRFLAAVFKLKAPGDISGPVEVFRGFHIVKLIEVDPGKQLSYEEVKDRIISELKREYRASILKRLRSEAYPDPDQINYEALKDYLRKLLNREDKQENKGQEP